MLFFARWGRISYTLARELRFQTIHLHLRSGARLDFDAVIASAADPLS